jgi:hypothetical protein
VHGKYLFYWLSIKIAYTDQTLIILKKRLLFCLIIFCLLFSIKNANAQAYSGFTLGWTGGSGNWSNIGSWTGGTGSYPGNFYNGDGVSISSNVTVTIAAPLPCSASGAPINSIYSLTIGNGVTVNLVLSGLPALNIVNSISVGAGSTLNISGPGDIIGASAVTLAAGAKITTTANVTFAAASMTMNNGSAATFNGALNLSGALQTSTGTYGTSTLTTNATGNTIGTAGSDMISVHSQDNLIWNGTGTTTVTGNTQIYTNGTTAATSTTLTIGAGNSVTFNGKFVIDASNNYTAFFVNNGTTSITGAVSTNTPNTPFTAITNTANSSLTFGSTVVLAKYLTVLNQASGNMYFNSGSFLELTSDNTYFDNEGNATFQTGLTIPPATQTAGVLVSGQNCLFTNNGALFGTSTYFLFKNSPESFTNGGSMQITACPITLQNTAMFVNTGTVQASGNSDITMNGGGNPEFDNNAGSVQISGSKITLGINPSYLKNSALFVATSCTFVTQTTGSNGIIYNYGTGTFNAIACTFTLTTQGGSIDNSGTFTATKSTTFDLNSTNQPGANITNESTGTFNIGLDANSNCSIILENGGQNVVTNNNVMNLGPLTVVSMTSSKANVNNAAGTFTLMSDATGSAAFSQITSGATVSGTFNVQRYITGNAAATTYSGYRLLGSPTNITSASASSNNNISFNTLKNSYIVNGVTYYGIYTGGPGATGLSTTLANPTIYLYNETYKTNNKSFISGKNVGLYLINANQVETTSTATSALTNIAVSTAPSALLNIPVGNGYIVYFAGPTNAFSATKPGPATITNVGFINQQSFTLNLWYTPGGASTSNKLSFSVPPPASTADKYQGYNMIGNPYPSTISLKTLYNDNFNASTNKISSNFYELYNQSPSNGYVVYSANGGTSDSRASQFVVSGQGFFTVSTAANQFLTFNEDQKPTTLTNLTSPTLVLAANINQPPVTGTLPSINSNSLASSPSMQNSMAVQDNDTGLKGLHMKMWKDSITYNECGIYFGKNWDDKLDIEDAAYFAGANKVLMSSNTTDGYHTAINKLADFTKGKNVKLNVNASADGAYNLSLADFQNIDTAIYNIYLLDHLKKDSLDIARYKTYIFDMKVSDTTTFANRFELAIELKPRAPYQLISFNGQKEKAGVLLTWKTYNEGTFTGFTIQKADGTTVQFKGLYSKQSDGSSIYTYVDPNPVMGGNTYRLQQNDITGAISYSSTITIIYNPNGTPGVMSVFPNPTKASISVNVATETSAAPTYKANIYSSTGQLMIQKSVTGNNWTQDVTQYTPGTYIIQLTDSDGKPVGKSKFVKTN